jgi:hypothetical protein
MMAMAKRGSAGVGRVDCLRETMAFILSRAIDDL